MPCRLFADAVVLIHLGFVAFVVFGGLLVLRWHRLAWLHVPAVAWGVGIELVGGVCPLTPIENGLRAMGGGSAYSGDFVERYVLPALYPADLRRDVQMALGLLALAINVAVYLWVWRRSRLRQRA